jgi:hypothetical protein
LIYSTAQVAKKIGVRSQTLEEWLRHGLKAPPKRNISGAFVRLWDERDLEHAKEFSLKQPKQARRQQDPRNDGIRVFTSAEVANSLKINKMTVMRRVSSGRVKRPKLFTSSAIGVTWLWSKEEMARLRTLRNVLLDPRWQHLKGPNPRVRPG